MKVTGVCIAVLLTISAAASQSPALLPGTRILTGTSTTRGLAVADLDGDGLLDIVSSGDEYNSPPGIRVMLGTGDGTFSAPTPYASPTGLLVVHDVTGDGVPDVIGAYVDYQTTTSTSHVWVRAGNGDGTLAETIDTAFGSGENYGAMSLNDLDGDGHLDVVLLDVWRACVQIVFGNGDATFGRFQSLSLDGRGAAGLSIDDFDQDGTLDIATTSGQFVVVFLAQGQGAFASPVKTLTQVGYIADIQSVDLDSDGVPDIAVSGQDWNSELATGRIQFLRGSGNGVFAGNASQDVPAPVWAIRFVAFDKDSSPDLLACGTDWYPSTFTPHGPTAGLFTLKGSGGFDFFPAESFAVGGEPISFDVGDFDGDGYIDAVIGHEVPYTSTALQEVDLGVAFGQADGRFAAATTLPLSTPPHQVDAADFDQDGYPDVLIAATSGCLVALSHHDGSFAAPVNVLRDATLNVIAADMNGDHVPDLVLEGADFLSNLSIALGLGSGTNFEPPMPFAGGFPSALQTADFDADGNMDIAATFFGGKVAIWNGHGDGTVGIKTQYDTSGDATNFVVASLNRDLSPDVAVTNGAAQSVGILLGSATGTLSAVKQVPVTIAPDLIAAGDLDRDGTTDLVVASTTDTVIDILRGTGAADFTVSPLTALPERCSAIQLADLDRDGVLDIVALHPATDGLSFLRGDGTGSFGPPLSFFTATQPTHFVMADFDRNGFVDLAVTSGVQSAIWIDLNASTVFSNLGYALAPSTGIKPRLTGTGTPVADQLVTLTVTNVPVPSFGLMFMGLDTLLQPYKGGILVPRIDAAVPIRPAFPLSGRWPKGLDAGTPVYFQAWFATPSTGGGAISATNALVTISQ